MGPSRRFVCLPHKAAGCATEAVVISFGTSACRASKQREHYERCRFLPDAWVQGPWDHAPVEGARAVMRDLRDQAGIVCVVVLEYLVRQVLRS